VPSGETTIDELLALLPEGLHSSADSILGVRTRAAPSPANTTISVVVTNQRMTYAMLQRLAIQVHASMARAIQPFATANDGDVLFAVSTDEVDNPALAPTDLGTLASEAMWDAVLASVPDLPSPAGAGAGGAAIAAAACRGRYSFARDAAVSAEVEDSLLRLRVAGERSLYGRQPGQGWDTALAPDGSFALEDVFLRGGRFVAGEDGSVGELELNPGLWMQRGRRSAD
jgi:hypothetical protein